MEGLQGVYARNCIVRRIDEPTASAFLNHSHRLGSAASRYRYGVFVSRRTGSSEVRLDPGTLVAVATFSSARRWIKSGRRVSSYEWVRYASLPGIRVIGGMSKALDAFVEDVHPDDVMTYTDPDGGEVYRLLGFTLEGEIERPEGHRTLKYRRKYIDY